MLSIPKVMLFSYVAGCCASLAMHLDSIGACPCPQVEASRKMTLSRLPPVLVLHLKQFSFTNKGSQKLNKPIEYSMELEIPRGEQLCGDAGWGRGVRGLPVLFLQNCWLSLSARRLQWSRGNTSY